MSSLRVSENIIPLSDFKARASELLRNIARSGAPIVITLNGRAAGVLLSPEDFDALTERAQFVGALTEGLADAESGRFVDHQSMVAEATVRYDAQDE